MKNLKKLVILFIVFALVIAIAPIFFEAQKIIAIGMTLFILPFIFLEFAIPANILKKIGVDEKIPWYSHITNYLIVFPIINLWLLLSLNGIFGFLPEISVQFNDKEVLQMSKETIIFLLKFDALIYLGILSVAYIVRYVFREYKEEGDE